ncbi:hypothetical protein [Xenorhabdus szentirmaii]|uniref:Bacteriophage protein n=1 Tax=Xenorhabdus szentirmaii DSM 16338 TaxID=1427518 RepID=W1J5V2_9GAMM|nr:hypothetical protein [Xenorhabdus szentirmaii]PHM32003.1 bacteriophage protein [Xenorhabdus szentirmaii DSM 16338]CDL85408.1 conserved hypothetical protein [Xenorhabdus szentirmaii DSM 16338]
MKSGLTIKVDKANAILDALKTLGNRDVLVGVPAENSSRDDVPFGNAGIGYINEFGSPAQNIPARAHLRPGIRSVEERTTEQLKIAANAVLDGKQDKAEKALNKAGIIAVNGVKNFMTSHDFEPLADPTVEARARRGRKAAKAEMENRKAGIAPNNANARPLIDTGAYRRSITYVVRNKGE